VIVFFNDQIESKSSKIKEMKVAANDPLFLAGIKEIFLD